jgi:hypothetical protein
MKDIETTIKQFNLLLQEVEDITYILEDLNLKMDVLLQYLAQTHEHKTKLHPTR